MNAQIFRIFTALIAAAILASPIRTAHATTSRPTINHLLHTLKHLPEKSTAFSRTKKIATNITRIDPSHAVIYYKLSLRAMQPSFSRPTYSFRLVRTLIKILRNSKLPEWQKNSVLKRLILTQRNFDRPSGQ